MRVLLLSCLWVTLVACNNLEKSKCLEACKIDHQSASATCETSDDPGACKQKAETAKAQCTKNCDASR